MQEYAKVRLEFLLHTLSSSSRFIISARTPRLPPRIVHVIHIANLSLFIDCPTNKTGLAANTSYFITICLVKVTILMLYLRTFTESKRFRNSIFAVLAILGITHVVTLAVYLADVYPLHCHWSIYATDEEWYANCSDNYDSLPAIVCIAVVTIVLDIVILALPCPAVWRLHMAKRQKIAIQFLLVAGVMYETLPPSPTSCACTYKREQES